MSKPEISRATIEDLKGFYGDQYYMPTGKFWKAEIDQDLVAIGGYARTPKGWFGFLELKDPMRQFPMHIGRMGKRVLMDWKRTGKTRLSAIQNPNEPTAERWLTSLGFKQDEEDPEIWVKEH